MQFHKKPCWLTAMVFSLIPPTGRIFPVRDTSPVMATFWRAGVLVAKDSRAVTMVHPALGPSLGVAPWAETKTHLTPTEPATPAQSWLKASGLLEAAVILTSGTWRWMWDPTRNSFSGCSFMRKERANVYAILALSFITSPSCPVSSSVPSLAPSFPCGSLGRLREVSMNSVEPPEEERRVEWCFIYGRVSQSERMKS